MNYKNASLLFILLFSFINSLLCEKPHIILIVASDLGFGDVGYHGTSEIPTPNIDALAYSGIVLRNYYVNTFSSHSRSALMTGKYPLYPGWHHDISPLNSIGLPTSEKLLPQYLKMLGGYKNHMVGKWHLGHRRMEETPLFRGFDSHLGCWTGHQDYYDHTNVQEKYWGYDMRRNFEIADDLHGKHATDIYTDESVKIIENHGMSKSLFLYIAYTAVKEGNHYNRLPATDKEMERFRYIRFPERRKYAVLLSKLDESVGRITEALATKGILNNSIIIFTGDNGGPCRDKTTNGASNYPFRGCKGTFWEGGTRTPAFIWSNALANNSRIFNGPMHIMDWLPTLLHAVEPNFKSEFEKLNFKMPRIDGFNMWPSFLTNEKSPRSVVFHGFTYSIGNIRSGGALTENNIKIIYAAANFSDSLNEDHDKWVIDRYNKNDYSYDYNLVKHSKAALVLPNWPLRQEEMEIFKYRFNFNCSFSYFLKHAETYPVCDRSNLPCIFDLEADPCEFYNIYGFDRKLDVRLLSMLNLFLESSTLHYDIQPNDEMGKPKYWNYVYDNFKERLFWENSIFFLYITVPAWWEYVTTSEWCLVFSGCIATIIFLAICLRCRKKIDTRDELAITYRGEAYPPEPPQAVPRHDRQSTGAGQRRQRRRRQN